MAGFEAMEAVADQFEMFPDMPTVALPKRAKNVWEQLKEMNELVEKHGQLLPVSMAAEMLDLSRQRVYQLIDDGTLKPVEWRGQQWLTERDIRSFVEIEREAGRPWKEPSAKEMWKRSMGYARKRVRK